MSETSYQQHEQTLSNGMKQSDLKNMRMRRNIYIGIYLVLVLICGAVFGAIFPSIGFENTAVIMTLYVIAFAIMFVLGTKI